MADNTIPWRTYVLVSQASRIFPLAHAHEEKYGWLARLRIYVRIYIRIYLYIYISYEILKYRRKETRVTFTAEKY